MKSELLLEDVCDLIVDCPHRTAPESAEVDPYAYAVGTKAIGNGRIDFSKARPVDRVTYDSWTARTTPRTGDLILCREAPVGPVARVRSQPLTCLGQRTVLLRANEEVIQSDYLMYALLSPQIQNRLKAMSEGSTVAHLNVADVRTFRLEVPSLTDQLRVSSVLNTLDDKIDSNRRIAEHDEVVAKTAFNSDSFGSSKGRDSQRREKVAAKRAELKEFVNIAKGSVRPASHPTDMFEHFSIAAYDDGRKPELVAGEAMRSAKTELPSHDCVMLSRLNPQRSWRIWWPRPRGIAKPVCSTEFVVLVPHGEVPVSYLFALLAYDQDVRTQILEYVSGTTGSRQRVKPGEILATQIPASDSVLMNAWDSFARSLYDHAECMAREANALQAIRNALLPKLISGEIQVPDTADPDEAVAEIAGAGV